jgi:hypothetical protein
MTSYARVVEKSSEGEEEWNYRSIAEEELNFLETGMKHLSK